MSQSVEIMLIGTQPLSTNPSHTSLGLLLMICLLESTTLIILNLLEGSTVQLKVNKPLMGLNESEVHFLWVMHWWLHYAGRGVCYPTSLRSSSHHPLVVAKRIKCFQGNTEQGLAHSMYSGECLPFSVIYLHTEVAHLPTWIAKRKKKKATQEQIRKLLPEVSGKVTYP